jgi:hypothetical protein
VNGGVQQSFATLDDDFISGLVPPGGALLDHVARGAGDGGRPDTGVGQDAHDIGGVVADVFQGPISNIQDGLTSLASSDALSNDESSHVQALDSVSCASPEEVASTGSDTDPFRGLLDEIEVNIDAASNLIGNFDVLETQANAPLPVDNPPQGVDPYGLMEDECEGGEIAASTCDAALLEPVACMSEGIHMVIDLSELGHLSIGHAL